MATWDIFLGWPAKHALELYPAGLKKVAARWQITSRVDDVTRSPTIQYTVLIILICIVWLSAGKIQTL